MSVRLPNPMSAVVWLAFLVPFAFFGAWADRSFGAAVFLLGCAVMVAKPSPWEAREPSKLALKIFLLLEFLYVVSAMYSAAFNGYQMDARDCFELPRYIILGAFVAYLIRHYDAHVRVAMDWAAAAGVYVSLLLPSADPQGYAACLTLCWLVFFSRLRLRWLHAATAALVVIFSGSRSSWTAAFLVVAAAASLRLYRVLARRRVKHAARLGLVFCAVLLASPAVYLRASRAAAAPPIASFDSIGLQFMRRSPVFGWGPSEFPGRSQYLFWTLKGGALGAAAILGGLILVGYRVLRAVRADSTHLVGAVVFLACAALMLASGRFWESYRLFFLTSFFAAGIHGPMTDKRL
ncbi:MAG: hypothetical protein ACHQ2Z_07230 [Elusimicrobiota bacterium]